MKDDYKSLGGVGLNYDAQMRRQREIEKHQKESMDYYNNEVEELRKNKLIDRQRKELQDSNEVRIRYDKEKEFIER